MSESSVGFETFVQAEYEPTLRAAFVLLGDYDAALAASDGAFADLLLRWDEVTDADAAEQCVRSAVARRARSIERRERLTGAWDRDPTATYTSLGGSSPLDELAALPVERRVDLVFDHRPGTDPTRLGLRPGIDTQLAGQLRRATSTVVAPPDPHARIVSRARRRRARRRTVAGALLLAAVGMALVGGLLARSADDDRSRPPGRALEQLPLLDPGPGTGWQLVEVAPGERYALTLDATGDGRPDAALEVARIGPPAVEAGPRRDAEVMLAGTTPVIVDRGSAVPTVTWYPTSEVRAELTALPAAEVPESSRSEPDVDQLLAVVRATRPGDPDRWADEVAERAPRVIPLILPGGTALESIRWRSGLGPWNHGVVAGSALLWTPEVPWGQLELSFTSPIGSDPTRPASEPVRGTGVSLRGTTGQLVATAPDDDGRVRQEVRWSEGPMGYALTFGADVPLEVVLGLVAELEVPQSPDTTALLFPATAPSSTSELVALDPGS